MNIDEDKKLTKSDYDRAFVEISTALYELYRKHKYLTNITSNSNKENNDETTEKNRTAS